MTVASKYTQYANDVLSGKITACQYTKDVCTRFLEWLQRTDIIFVPEKVDHVVNFVQRLEHFQGEWAGRKFLLSDW